MMRTFVIPPADVKSNTFGGNIAKCMVEDVNVGVDCPYEVIVALIPIHDVATHREIGCVDLEHKSVCNDLLVLLAHSLAECFEVRGGVAVVLIRVEQSDDTWRGGIDEGSGRGPLGNCDSESIKISSKWFAVLVRHRSS